MRRLSLSAAFSRLRVSWWLIPAACVVGAGGLSLVLGLIDGAMADDRKAWFLFGGGPDGARELLAVVATSMLTFTGLVFSVTVLVLQLASTQFSPRVLRTFLKDRATQLSLGVFVGTFVYALLTLRGVRGGPGGVEAYVPSLSVWAAGALALACVGVFIFYIHHVAQSIRAVRIIERIASETRGSLDRLFPEGIGSEPEDPRVQRPPGTPAAVIPHGGEPGVLVQVDEDDVLGAAKRAGVVVALRPLVGDFVPHGEILFEVWGDTSALDGGALTSAVVIERERTLVQDTAFGFRQLVDVAERALSPGINDPSTAVQVIDQLHDLLRRLARRRFPQSNRVDEDGALRLVLPRPDFSSYVRLAFDEIRQFGAGSIQVVRRLRAAIESLRAVVPAHRRAELDRQAALLDAHVQQAFFDPRDRHAARVPSAQGNGPPLAP